MTTEHDEPAAGAGDQQLTPVNTGQPAGFYIRRARITGLLFFFPARWHKLPAVLYVQPDGSVKITVGMPSGVAAWAHALTESEAVDALSTRIHRWFTMDSPAPVKITFAKDATPV